MRLLGRSLLLFALPACSAILDFSNRAVPTDAGPPDSRYTTLECEFDESNDTLDTAASVVAGFGGPAAICPTSPGTDDVDFYRFESPGSAIVSIELDYPDVGPTGALDLTLYDANDVVLSTDTDGSNAKAITCPSTTGPTCAQLGSGTYVFEVSPAASGNANAYTFTLSFDTGSGSDMGSGSGAGSG